MELLIILLNTVLLLTFILLQFKVNKSLFKILKKEEFQKPAEGPNTISQTDDEFVEFSQGNPLDLPKDVKIEIEGGDALSPYEMN